MPQPRRTQKERREETIGRLLSATVECLATKGYSGTTTAAICAEAGLSQGALFRHFATRQELLVATAEYVAFLQVATFRQRFAGRTITDAATMEQALVEMARLARSRENRTWHELVVASGSDAELLKALLPALDNYRHEIFDAAGRFFGDRLPPGELAPLMTLVLNFLDGMVFAQPVVRSQASRDDAVRLMAAMISDRLVHLGALAPDRS
jgi:AcrR family transcriptional regulator